MKIDIYQEVTNQIIEQMETSGTNWMAPFTSGGGMPQNAVTRAHYNGINVLMLGLFNRFTSNEWASYKQWATKGAQVIKGSKGTRIVFFKMLENKKKAGEFFPMIRYSTVFNADQVEGYTPAAQAEAVDLTERLSRVDEYVSHINARIEQGSPCYIPSLDLVNMPDRSAFMGNDEGTATEHYYSTLFHELGHWTGHKSRLDRLELKNKHGYAFEELIAELSAAFQCRKHGIDSEPRADHAQYLAGWLRALKDDKKFIFQASAKAQKVVEFLDSKQPELIEYQAA